MAKHAIIEADFTTFRPVAGRKVLQLVFEIPIENAEKAMSALGYPVPGQSKWCAIALLDLKAAQANEVSGSPKLKWDEMPYSKQAAIRCQDKEFQRLFSLKDENEAADYVRGYCGVSTRTDIKAGGPSGDRWLKLEEQYQRLVTTQKYGEVRR